MAEDNVPARSALAMTFDDLPANLAVVASGTEAGSHVLATPVAGAGPDARVEPADLAATAMAVARPMSLAIPSSSSRPSRKPSLTRGEAAYALGDHDLVAAA